MIIKTKFVPKTFDAFTLWPFIFVRNKPVPEGLLIHEMVHYNEQKWCTPLWVLKYLISKKFRFAAEIRGYQAQIKAGHITIDRATALLLLYNLSVSSDAIRTALNAPTNNLIE